MRVVVKYFSALRDVTGKAREEVTVAEGATLSQLLEWFFKSYPKAETFREVLYTVALVAYCLSIPPEIRGLKDCRFSAKIPVKV